MKKRARNSVFRFIVANLFLWNASLGILAQEQPDALRLYQNGDFSQAIEVCLLELEERGSDQVRQRMDSYTVLGWAFMATEQYEDALNYARQARLEIRYDIRLIEIEAEALFYLGHNLESLVLFEEYVALSPTGGDRTDLVYYFMGEIFLRLEEYRHADMAFSAALYRSPQRTRWWARLGYAREQIPDTETALLAYNRVLEMEPFNEAARVGIERLNQ